MSEEERKIFIDEGWKAQVQREKEEAARKALAGEAEGTEAQADQEPAAESENTDEPGELDPTSFTGLVGTLATQAMFALGLVADPDSGRVMVNLEAARYTLDMLAMLKEKTAGNLTDEESDALNRTCDELEQAFAVRVSQFEEQAARQSGVDLNNLKGD